LERRPPYPGSFTGIGEGGRIEEARQNGRCAKIGVVPGLKRCASIGRGASELECCARIDERVAVLEQSENLGSVLPT